MDLEALKQEAEEKACAYIDTVEKMYGDGDVSDTPYTGYQVITAYEHGALDFAIPREEQIEELKKEWVKDDLEARQAYIQLTEFRKEYIPKLDKAKHIIKKLVEGIRIISDPKVELTDVDAFVAEAEQFLKECE